MNTERKLLDQLIRLKETSTLCGLKAEFEAEGSSYRDLVRLRVLSSKAGVKLFLKIGGVEALRDIKDAYEIGVDGLIAPMVESKFALYKFIQACKSIYKNDVIHKTINIETVAGVKHFDEILDLACGSIDNITIGRTDLSNSYFDESVVPDSDHIIELIKRLGEKTKERQLEFSVGGSVSVKTVELLEKDAVFWNSLITKLETRKVIFSAQSIIGNSNTVKDALKFEELYILSKKEISDLFLEAELSRLTKLKLRT